MSCLRILMICNKGSYQSKHDWQIMISFKFTNWNFVCTQIDLVFWVGSFHRVVTIVATQAKEGLYHDWHLTNMFLPPCP